MENQSTLNVKKIVYIVISIIVFLILVEWLWHYLHTGEVIITTNSSQNKITLTFIDSENIGGATSSVFKASGKLSVNLGLGRYEATVSNGQQSTTQLVNLSSHKTLRYNIALNNLLYPQPVISTEAQDIALSSNQLAYLNTNTENVNYVDSSNNLSVFNPSSYFQTIKWANTSYGVGQDSKQDLYLINNGSVNLLNLAFTPNKYTAYDVASNKQIYVSNGSSVYMGNQSNSFKKIYTAPSSSLILGGSDNKVAIAYSTGGDDDDDSGVILSVVSSTGHAIKTTVGDDVSSIKWSPNNQYIASINESSVNIYSSSLHLVVAIPTSLPTGYLSWVNNSEFVYAVNNKIWSYNLSSGKAHLLANLPLDSSASGLAVSSDGSYVYVSAINTINDSNSAILRIALDGQQTSAIASQLQVILPMTLTDCTISLVNFAQTPTILIEPSSPQSSLGQSYYIQEAQSQLQQDGFNTSLLNFSVGQD